jgi:hypothetical protein
MKPGLPSVKFEAVSKQASCLVGRSLGRSNDASNGPCLDLCLCLFSSFGFATRLTWIRKVSALSIANLFVLPRVVSRQTKVDDWFPLFLICEGIVEFLAFVSLKRFLAEALCGLAHMDRL